jgi:hypothetical protein
VICCGWLQGPGDAPDEVMHATMNAAPGLAVGAGGMVAGVEKVPLGGACVAGLMIVCCPFCWKTIRYWRAGLKPPPVTWIVCPGVTTVVLRPVICGL